MGTGLLMLASLAAYFALLFALSRRSGGTGGNDDFFRAARSSPWGMVAFGMIGASVSGVSLVSVPGWVGATRMTYLQMCLGFVVGYVAVALVLLPLYYRLRLTSIYAYLGQRFGGGARRTGAFFFLLSKLTAAAARLYLAAVVIAAFLPRASFSGAETLVAALSLLFIYMYTRRGGIRTLVRTDALQTACMLAALVGVLWAVGARMGMGFGEMARAVSDSPLSQVFEWDWRSPSAFWRQFLSGVFIVVVMTGLDQDMMQKNLTCRSLRAAQKDMCAYGLAFVPVNLLLLSLGVLLHVFCSREGIVPPAQGDALLPSLVAGGALGPLVVVPFSVGMVAAAFSSADSAVTSLTTSLCVDILGVEGGMAAERAERVRRRAHVGVCLAFMGCILLFRALNSRSVIDAIYVMASYTYGPLLGLYAFGMFTRRAVRPRAVPFVAICAPVVCALLDRFSPSLLGYTFGYELLLLNGSLAFAGLWLFSSSARRTSS